jgi:hypothetical protein
VKHRSASPVGAVDAYAGDIVCMNPGDVHDHSTARHLREEPDVALARVRERLADAPLERFHAIPRERLAQVASESELPEVNAWRRVFSRMGLKSTQYRCASESLLRRFRKEGNLPRIHPLIDLCNAASTGSRTRWATPSAKRGKSRSPRDSSRQLGRCFLSASAVPLGQ